MTAATRATRATRTLSTRELNRALLGRQLLLERANVTVPRALELVAGLQAQYAPAMYVGLWSRVEGFVRHDLTGALERRTVMQGTLLRATIHLVSPRDYWPFAVAVREERRRWWLRAVRHQASTADMEAAAARLVERLREGPVRRAELDQIVGKPLANGVGLWVDLVRVPPSGTWERRRADLYGLAEDWLGPPDAEAGDGVQATQAGDGVQATQAGDGVQATQAGVAMEHLVRRYLGGFGPATPGELADWAGLPVKTVVPVMERLRLRRFLAEDAQELFDLPRAPLPAATTVAPVRFLPVWDATLLVHARRKAILPEQYRPLVFNTKTPHSVPTFLVDGAVAGTWRYEGGTVRLDPFEPLPPSTMQELRVEADRLAAFHR